MHMDNKNTLIIAGIVVVALVAFAGIALQRSDVSTETDRSQVPSDWAESPAESPDTRDSVTQKTIITAKHRYRSGVHTIVGEIALPTPCHILETAAVVSNDAKSVVIQLASSVKTGEICAQVITPARFKVTAKADAKATFTAMWNGAPVTLNLIEAEPDEDLDAFELYIKG
jgi:hypothetical protein